MKLHNKKGKSIFWGLIFIAAALLIVLDATNIVPDLPLVKIVLGTLIGAWLISEVIKLRVKGIFFPLAFLFIISEQELIGYDFISNWIVLLAALLLTIGTHLIFGSGSGRQVFNGHSHVSCDKNFMSGKTCYIDCDGFKYRVIENSFGAYEVYFQNTDAYEGGAVIEIDNNFGAIELYVPEEWNVVLDVKTVLGATEFNGGANRDGKRLDIIGSTSFGVVEVNTIK